LTVWLGAECRLQIASVSLRPSYNLSFLKKDFLQFIEVSVYNKVVVYSMKSTTRTSTMPILVVPNTGLQLDSSASPRDPLPMQAFGITLNDSMIEDMIKCVQSGHSVELTLGSTPVSLVPVLSQVLDLPIHYPIYKRVPQKTVAACNRTVTLVVTLPGQGISSIQ
jgi:hypothetical protein